MNNTQSKDGTGNLKVKENSFSLVTDGVGECSYLVCVHHQLYEVWGLEVAYLSQVGARQQAH